MSRSSILKDERTGTSGTNILKRSMEKGESVVCSRCGDFVKKWRWQQHKEFWCSRVELDDSDSENEKKSGDYESANEEEVEEFEDADENGKGNSSSSKDKKPSMEDLKRMLRGEK